MTAAVAAPQVPQITLSSDELSTGQLESHTLQHAIEALHRDGLVVLTNAVDLAHLDKLNERMVPEAHTLYAQASTHRNFGAGTGNIQQEPILDKEYIFEDVVANRFAVQIVECMIGPRPQLRFYSANTLFKAPGRQPVHIDVEFDFPRVPFGYAININLIATSPENGSTEVWLGSHQDTSQADLDEDGLVRADLLETRRKISPGVQASLPKGALIIRDMRLWHAWMPNRTDDPRIMLVTILFPRWYRSAQKIFLPRSLKGRINWGDVDVCVEWVDDDYDYLKGRHDHDFILLP